MDILSNYSKLFAIENKNYLLTLFLFCINLNIVNQYKQRCYIVLRVWFSGRIPPCQGEDAGSIPATRHLYSNKIQKMLNNIKILLLYLNSRYIYSLPYLYTQ